MGDKTVVFYDIFNIDFKVICFASSHFYGSTYNNKLF